MVQSSASVAAYFVKKQSKDFSEFKTGLVSVVQGKAITASQLGALQSIGAHILESVMVGGISASFGQGAVAALGIGLAVDLSHKIVKDMLVHDSIRLGLALRYSHLKYRSDAEPDSADVQLLTVFMEWMFEDLDALLTASSTAASS